MNLESIWNQFVSILNAFGIHLELIWNMEFRNSLKLNIHQNDFELIGNQIFLKLMQNKVELSDIIMILNNSEICTFVVRRQKYSYQANKSLHKTTGELRIASSISVDYH